MFKYAACAAALCAITTSVSAGPVLLQESFDHVADLAGQGWRFINKSVGATADSSLWQQGNAQLFAAREGSESGYAMATFTSSALGAAGLAGAIENWLITPLLSLDGAVSLEFYARTQDAEGWADGLDIRAGVVDAATGEWRFDQSLGSLNPQLLPNGVSSEWTRFRFNAAFGQGHLGQLAFVYKADGASANLMALDDVRIQAVPEPSSYALAGLGLVAAFAARQRRHKHTGTAQ